jgi:hypothetical protein
MSEGCSTEVPRTNNPPNHEFHGGTLAAEETHRVVDKRLEGIRDLPHVTHIVVEDQRNRRGAVAVEDPLALIGENVKAAGLVVFERREKLVPPRVREVLRSVDDYRVKSMSVLELCCKLGHLEREVVFR